MPQGAELATAYVSISASTRGLGKDIAKAMGSPEIAKTGDKAGRSIGSRLGGVLKKSAVGVGVAAGGLLGTALTKGFGRLNAIDQAQAKLRGLGHDAKSVGSIMDNALASVKGTAFGLDEAATTAAGVVAAGIKPGKELTQVLKTTADTATIAGTSFKDMGAIFGSVAARGKLQGDDMLQLTSRGVPVLQFLAKQYGVTAKKASEMVSKGKVDFKSFEEAMRKGLGGAALDSGKTVSGAWSNMWASVSRIGANLLSGIFPKLAGAFTGITKWLGPIEDAAKGAGEAIGGFIARVVKGAKGLFAVFARGDFTKDLRQAFGVAEDSKFVDFLFDVRDAAKNAFGYLMDTVVPAVVSGFKQLLSAAAPILPAMIDIGKALIPLGQGAASEGPGLLATAFGLLKGAVEGVSTVLQGVAKFATEHGTAFRAMAGSVLAVVAAVKIYGLVVKGITIVTKAWALAQRVLNAVMKANPIGLIITGLTLLAAGLTLAWKHSETFRNIVTGAWDAIKTAVKFAWDRVIKPIFQLYKFWYVTVLWGAVKKLWDLAKKAWGGISDAVKWAWRNVIKPTFDALRDAVGMLGDKFGDLRKWIAKVWGGIKSAVWSAVRWVVDKFLWFAQKILDAAAKAFGWVPGLGGKLKSAASKFGDFRKEVNRQLGNINDKTVNVTAKVEGLQAVTKARIAMQGRNPTGLADGGTVPGQRTPYGDKVLRWLAPGEEVISNRRGEADRFRALRAAGMIPGLADGGTVFNVRPRGLTTGAAKFATASRDMNALLSGTAQAIRKAIDGLTKTLAPAPGRAGAAGGAARWAGVGLQVLKMFGFGREWLPRLLARMNVESGGNPYAVNRWDSNWRRGTPSVGLMQVIGPTFAAYAGRFRGLGPFMYGTSINPLANIYAAVNYALKRYGVPAVGGTRGYATGTTSAKPGLALVGERGPELVSFHGGERVLNARATRQRLRPGLSDEDLQRLASALSAAGSVGAMFPNATFQMQDMRAVEAWAMAQGRAATAGGKGVAR